MILKLKDTTLEFLTGMDKCPWLINLKTFDLLQYVDMTLKMLPKENNVVFFQTALLQSIEKNKILRIYNQKRSYFYEIHC